MKGLDAGAAASRSRPVGPPYPSPRYAAYVIGVLMLVTLLSLLDRQLPTLLVQPIRSAFNVSDTQISLLQGYAFALVYTVMGLPFGRLVDRANRRNIIVFGIVIWSAMTIASGFAQSFRDLLLCRMGVGVGEACLAPAAFSLIADYVEPSRHGRAIGAYYTSLALGSGASLFFGGVVLRALPQHGPIDFIGHAFAPWQILFVLAGLPGLFAAGLLFTVKEVPRRDRVLGAPSPRERATIAEFLGYVRIHRRAFTHVYACYALAGFVGYAVTSWAATFYVRHFSLPIAQAGIVIGALSAVVGVAGPVTGGLLSDMREKKAAGRRFQVLLVAIAILLPALVAWALCRNILASFALFAIVIFASAMAASSGPAAIQAMVPNRMRGQAVACYLLLSFLIGFALGPTAVALVTDYVFHDDMALGYSIALVSTPVLILCGVLCWSGLEAYRATSTQFGPPD